MISNEEVRAALQTLMSMYPANKAPADGCGIYLGDGLHKPLRSQMLADCLAELLDLRWQARQKPDYLQGDT